MHNPESLFILGLLSISGPPVNIFVVFWQFFARRVFDFFQHFRYLLLIRTCNPPSKQNAAFYKYSHKAGS